LILVHDVTNKKSFSNLRKWIFEILNTISPSESKKWTLREEKQVSLNFILLLLLLFIHFFRFDVNFVILLLLIFCISISVSSSIIIIININIRNSIISL
jgi:hypothetical protein